MRIIKSSEQQYTCKKCHSIIGMRPDEISTISPPGPYDMDYEPDEIGKKYWDCPVCKCRNWMSSSYDYDD